MLIKQVNILVNCAQEVLIEYTKGVKLVLALLYVLW